MPPTSKQTPLPLAPNRAALSNEISLLLSRRTALLKTLNPTSTSSTSTSSSRKLVPDADAIEQLFSGPRPNQGVGYVPERNNDGDAASARDQTLRRKLLGGKNYKSGKGVGMKKGAESESEEEEGRSALGKRKRPRREEVVRDDGGEREGEGVKEKEDVSTDAVGGQRTEEEEERIQNKGHDEVEDGERKHDTGDDNPVKETAAVSDNAADEAKRDKKRKKRQREKQKQKQKREQK
ncbi:hypothetical protein V8C44DRAFT_331360 [Trichoderma aethiopicum]